MTLENAQNVEGCLICSADWRWRLQHIAGPVNIAEDQKTDRKIKPKWGWTGTFKVSLKWSTSPKAPHPKGSSLLKQHHLLGPSVRTCDPMGDMSHSNHNIALLGPMSLPPSDSEKKNVFQLLTCPVVLHFQHCSLSL